MQKITTNTEASLLMAKIKRLIIDPRSKLRRNEQTRISKQDSAHDGSYVHPGWHPQLHRNQISDGAMKELS